jgi:hypothetical protein
MSVFADALYQYGGQPVGPLFASPWSTVRFVDGEDGNDNNSGLKPVEALKTIQAAVTASTRGDVIYVRPLQYTGGTGFSRYTEEVTVTAGASAGSAAHFENANISIIGTVNTPNPEYGVRWKHLTDTSGYCLINKAPALHLENLGFYAEGAAGAVRLLCNGATTTQRGSDGTTFTNCVVKAGRVITADGGDGLTFRNVYFHAAPAGGATGGITFTCSANPGRRLKILDCQFIEGNGAASATEYINIAGVASEVLIYKCHFGLIPTSGKFILATSTTGDLSMCSFAKADVHITNDLTLSSLTLVGNADGTANPVA